MTSLEQCIVVAAVFAVFLSWGIGWHFLTRGNR